MKKLEAVKVAKQLRLEGRDVRVAYQVVTHANANGAQKTSLVYRVVENGKLVA